MGKYQDIEPGQKIAIGQREIPLGTFCKYAHRINPVTGQSSLVFRDRNNRPATFSTALTRIFIEVPYTIRPDTPEQRVRAEDLSNQNGSRKFNVYGPFSPENSGVEAYNRDDLIAEGITRFDVRTRRNHQEFTTPETILILRDKSRQKVIIWASRNGRPYWVTYSQRQILTSKCYYGKQQVWRTP